MFYGLFQTLLCTEKVCSGSYTYFIRATIWSERMVCETTEVMAQQWLCISEVSCAQQTITVLTCQK